VRAILVTLVALAAVAYVGCDDGDDTLDDPRRGEIGGVAELAIGAYASVGPEALADYMSQEALAACPQERLEDALADHPVPTGFRQLRKVEFDGDSATATIIISSRDGEQDIVWQYVDEDGSWRISDMPGLENCEA
jgi:hypothetical protein